jgi:hypothetical protein
MKRINTAGKKQEPIDQLEKTLEKVNKAAEKEPQPKKEPEVVLVEKKEEAPKLIVGSMRYKLTD